VQYKQSFSASGMALEDKQANGLLAIAFHAGWLIAGAVVGVTYNHFGLSGVLFLDATTYALSITGVAGPGDMDQVPKGTMYVGLADAVASLATFLDASTVRLDRVTPRALAPTLRRAVRSSA